MQPASRLSEAGFSSSRFGSPTPKALHPKAWGRGAAAHPRTACELPAYPFGVRCLCSCFPGVRRCAATPGYWVELLRRTVTPGLGITGVSKNSERIEAECLRIQLHRRHAVCVQCAPALEQRRATNGNSIPSGRNLVHPECNAHRSRAWVLTTTVCSGRSLSLT